MKREIIKIDDEKCTGCGVCIPNCHEGALQMIDGKARLVSELMCDGLGACIGHCPEGAIEIETREAEPYSETETIKQMIPKGKNLIIAHLKHMKDHNEVAYLKEGVNYLKEHESELPFSLKEVIEEVHGNTKNIGEQKMHNHSGGCPGSRAISFGTEQKTNNEQSTEDFSELTHWPVQLHLLNPNAGYFQGADLVMAADCVAFAAGNFHTKYLKGKSLAIACPKLDQGKDIYIAKIKDMIDNAKVNTITVMVMEVPCCGGLLQIVKEAVSLAERKVPVKAIMISVRGEQLSEKWI